MIYKPGTLRKHFSNKRTSEIWVGQLPYFVMFQYAITRIKLKLMGELRVGQKLRF